VTSQMSEFDGKQLKSILHGELNLPSDETTTDEEKGDDEKTDDHKELIDKIMTALGDHVKDVRSTTRLTSSPACLVSDDHNMSANLERILKASGQELPGAKRILEVNPTHPLLSRLEAETDAQKLENWASMLFEQAVLAEGGRLDDPAAFVKRLNEMLLEMTDA
jgi:molecular chaperone HtpG